MSLTISDQDLAIKNGLMVLFMKDISRMIKLMEKENLFILMGIGMMEIG